MFKAIEFQSDVEEMVRFVEETDPADIVPRPTRSLRPGRQVAACCGPAHWLWFVPQSCRHSTMAAPCIPSAVYTQSKTCLSV